MKRKILTYNVIFQKETEGGFSVWAPDLPGCASQGETFEEAEKNIKEAIALYLEDADEEKEMLLGDPQNQFMVPITVQV